MLNTPTGVSAGASDDTSATRNQCHGADRATVRCSSQAESRRSRGGEGIRGEIGGQTCENEEGRREEELGKITLAGEKLYIWWGNSTTEQKVNFAALRSRKAYP